MDNNDKLITIERLKQFWSKFCVGKAYQNDREQGEIFNNYIDNIASGKGSHAEGLYTKALGEASHTEGWLVTSAGSYSHVQGKANIIDENNRYAHIIGNGLNDQERSNAHTVDWEGNAWYAGDIYLGGTSQDDATKLVFTELTEEEVEDLWNSIEI